MDHAVLILPPPKSMTENMSKAKWTTYIGKLFKERTKNNYRERKLKAFHKSPEYRTVATSSFSEFNIDSLQRSTTIMGQDDCIRATSLVVLHKFRQLVTSTVPQIHVPNVALVHPTVAPITSTSVPPTIVSSTHQFEAPIRRIVPTLTAIGATLAPLYIDTAMFALRAQQSITNWDDRSAYVFDNASRYLSLVQLHTTTTRPIQLHDQLLFLQADEHPFTPNDPWGT